MQKILRKSALFAAVYLAFYLITHPQSGLDSGFEAISLCGVSVIPALFPYLICSGFVVRSGFANLFSRYLSPVMRPLFGVPGSGAIAFVLGSVSGYPIGAVCVRDLYSSGECTRDEAQRMLAFCNNSGPLFVMSVLGYGFLGDAALGRLLYISHLFAAVLTGIVLRTFGKGERQTARALPKTLSAKNENPLRTIGEVMDSSIFTILKICGFVIFFSVLAKSLPETPISPFCHSALEITGGLAKLSRADINFSLKLSLISFFTAFSGLSVLLQVGSVVSNTDLSLKPYFFGKLIQGGFSFAITKILVSRLPKATDVFAKGAEWNVFHTPHSTFVFSICMLVFGALVLALLLIFSVLHFNKFKKTH